MFAATSGSTGFGAQPQTTQATSTFGFGSQPATSTPAFGATSTFGGFGATTQAPAATGIFGAANSQAPTAGIFGAGATTQTPATGLFGTTTSQPLFGATSQPTTGFFGTATSQPSTGLFGTTTTQPQAGGLFGTTTTQPQTGGLFGTTTTQPQTGGLFGTTTTQPQTGGLFGGSTTTPGLFGGPANSTAAKSAFSFGPATTANGSLFGNPAQPTANTQVGGLFPGQANTQPHIVQLMEQIKMNWNPESPYCHFRHYFYNMVHPNEAKYYVKPQNHDETLWLQAMNDNPDPSCMVPALAIGFGDIKKRMEQQEAFNLAHKAKLQEIRERLDKIERDRHLETAMKLKEFQRRHMQLAARVLLLMKKIQILRNLGYSIRAEEESLRVRLEAMSLQLKKPSQFRGRISELVAQVQMLKESGGLAASASPDWDVDNMTTKLVYQST
ncbi:hypothetical protein HK096_002259 [Nowakowskiella sp. JEL0078]|nr:hypothetical protein HK096_002259 [Nowakowskiella sp. JEL0078]